MADDLPLAGQFTAIAVDLTVSIKDATVTVRHEDRESVAVYANYPEHWLVTEDGDIQQIAVRQFYQDVHIFVRTSTTHVSYTFGEALAAIWRKLTGRVPKATAEVTQAPPPPPPPVTPAPQLGPDEVLILVPTNYRGGLELNLEGSRDCEVDHWEGTTFWLDSGSSGALTIGDVKITASFNFKHRSDGDCTLGDVEAASIDTELYSAYRYNLGQMKCEGDLALIQENDARVDVGNLDGQDFTVNLSGDESVNIGDINARGGVSFTRNGHGDLTVGDIKGEGNLSFEQGSDSDSNADVDVGVLEGHHVTVDLAGCNDVDLGIITAEDGITLNRYGDGDLTVGGMNAVDVTATLAGNGSHDIGPIDGTYVRVDHNDGDSGVDMDGVKAESFTLNHSSDGGVDIASLDTDVINVECSGSGDVNISSGTAKSGSVYNDGYLALYIEGRFGYISQKNDGEGSVEVRITA